MSIQNKTVSVVVDGSDNSILLVCYLITQRVGNIILYPTVPMSKADEQRIAMTFKQFLDDEQKVNIVRSLNKFERVEYDGSSLIIYYEEEIKYDIRAHLRGIADRTNRDFFFISGDIFSISLTSAVDLLKQA